MYTNPRKSQARKEVEETTGSTAVGLPSTNSNFTKMSDNISRMILWIVDGKCFRYWQWQREQTSFRRLRGVSKSPSKQMFYTSISRAADSAFQLLDEETIKAKYREIGPEVGGRSLKSSRFVDLVRKPLIFTSDRCRPRIRGVEGENFGIPLAITKVSGPNVITQIKWTPKYFQ